MLTFLGLGISGFQSIPNEGIEVLSKADIVYLEQFTSPIKEIRFNQNKKNCYKGRVQTGKKMASRRRK